MKAIGKYGSLRGLDLTNLFLADVREGIGPFLGIYLLSRHWNLADIGLVSSIAAFAGVLAQTPAGAYVDRSRHKHRILVVCTLVIGLGTAMILLDSKTTAVAISQALVGVAAAFIGPSIAGITLGLVGYKKLEQRTGRNEVFNHGGNVISAVISGAIGYFIGLKGIFVFTLLLSIASVFSIRQIRPEEIDNSLARGECDPKEGLQPVKKVLGQKFLIFFIACAVLFHFANAAMLPLAGQYIVSVNKVDASVYMSACIVIAQLIMVPVAAWSSRKAVKGRRWLMVLCFAILPLRGFLFTLSAAPLYVTAVQVLDGLSAGIFGVVSLLIIADLTKGSGRFNFINGIFITAVGLGASVSNAVAGYIANRFSFVTAFLFLAAVAGVALLVYLLLMKETYQPEPAARLLATNS